MNKKYLRFISFRSLTKFVTLITTVNKAKKGHILLSFNKKKSVMF